MILKHADVTKFLYQLGFKDAQHWDEDKLQEFAREVPGRFPIEKIPDRFKELYDRLTIAAETQEFITLKKKGKS